MTQPTPSSEPTPDHTPDRLSVVAGAGHSLQVEKPDEFWAALSEFLDGL